MYSYVNGHRGKTIVYYQARKTLYSTKSVILGDMIYEGDFHMDICTSALAKPSTCSLEGKASQSPLNLLSPLSIHHPYPIASSPVPLFASCQVPRGILGKPRKPFHSPAQKSPDILSVIFRMKCQDPASPGAVCPPLPLALASIPSLPWPHSPLLDCHLQYNLKKALDQFL